jgi:hypothetical protein
MAMSFRFTRGRQGAPKNGIAMENPVRIEPHVRSMIEGDGAVLLDLKAGRYYSLNGVAAKIWSRVEKGMTLPQILADLQQIYQVPAEKLTSDLTAFVRTMEEKGLLRASA